MKLAISKINDEIIANYLFENIFCIKNGYDFNTKLQIYENKKNSRNKIRLTPVHVAIHIDNLVMINAILDNNKDNTNIIFNAIIGFAVKNDYNQIEKLIDNKLFKTLIIKNDLLLQREEKGYSYKLSDKNSEFINENRSILDIFIQNNDVLSFSSMLLKLFEIYNINNFDDCNGVNSNNKIKILNNKIFENWIEHCAYKKYSVLLSFLTRIYEIAYKNKNFNLFISILNKNCKNGTKFNINEEVTSLSNQFKKDYKTALYLYENLKKNNNLSLLTELSKVINNGLIKQECGFNDSLLFLSKMVDNNQFIKCLKDVTNECLANDKKNVQKYQFFKSNLLHSNVWACTDDDNENKMNEINKMDSKIKNQLLLFDSIKRDIIDKELKLQQMFIQNNILSEVENNLESWNKLISKDIELFEYKNSPNQANKKAELMKGLIESKYNIKDLPFDTVNGFNGSKEYDHNGYLTDLLITTYIIDPLFQRDCKTIFNQFNTKYNIKCKYTSAPPKTKQRAITKAELDYKERQCM